MVFRVLSIDGGGIRGLYAAYILKRIHEELNIVYSDFFDLIVGTSTGSIIAGAIAVDGDCDGGNGCDDGGGVCEGQWC